MVVSPDTLIDKGFPPSEAHARALSLFLALLHDAGNRVRAWDVCGPPGAGKSTMCRAIDGPDMLIWDSCLPSGAGVPIIWLDASYSDCMDRMMGRHRQVPAQYVKRVTGALPSHMARARANGVSVTRVTGGSVCEVAISARDIVGGPGA